MIVPRYWAESRLRHRDRQRQVTIRRFGWSDISREAAQAHAEARAQEALQRALEGEDLPRREPRVPYNGAEGVPIREEIIERQGEAIVTRNSYGARCLNVPDVLFADVDFPEARPTGSLTCGVVIAALVFGVATGKVWAFGATLVGAVLAAVLLATVLHLVTLVLWFRAEALSRRRLSRFLQSRPGWSVRVYRTPAGLRLLAMQQPFAPDDPEVIAFFRAMGVDPVYARMCLRQRCFRARVSAKPWRIGIVEHIRPRRGVWPVSPEWEAPRAAWVAQYEAVARDFAACRYVETLGSLTTHSDVRRVQTWHDALCRAESGLPIA